MAGDAPSSPRGRAAATNPTNRFERIEVQAMSRDAAFRAAKALQALLRQRHQLQDDQPDDFRHYNRAEWAESAEESARILTWLLGSIASVSLLVGGIGIMNIMLVSVTERTREIGIRMALGGRRRDILWQFLTEAIQGRRPKHTRQETTKNTSRS